MEDLKELTDEQDQEWRDYQATLPNVQACVICNDNMVDANTGEDTCFSCKAKA